MSIIDDQKNYYRELWERFGEDPRSLGHRDSETQFERFRRLSRGWEAETGSFSVHEIGSGFGDFGLFLERDFPRAIYSGSEICEEFLEVSRRRLPGGRFFKRDIVSDPPSECYDYVTQSGTFNGRLGTPADEWQTFVFSMLSAMYGMARKGVAVNFLTSYADAERMSEELHYQDPKPLLDFVVGRLSRFYEIDAAGPLFEYTLRIHRPEFVRARYSAEPFERYFTADG